MYKVFSTLFDLLKFILHNKMNELNTLTLVRLDTCTIWFVIWIYCKHFFYSLNIKTTETTVLKQKQGCNVAIHIINIFPRIYCFIYFKELGFNSKYNSQHSSQKEPSN